ncbi:TIR domain-containing protein [Curtobacterium sp. PhB137]|nr:TIR domain-containing protein [Curtobacterium sp. PhB137]
MLRQFALAGAGSGNVTSMKVFISWSGAAEQHVAEALRDALISVCAGEVEPFVSSQDIPLGERGIPMIDAKLSATDYGIVVLSAANKDRPWINYEGGALATLLDRRVAVVLMDLGRAEVDTPLAPFQSVLFHDRAEMLRLFTEVAQHNRASFPAGTVATLFDAAWKSIQESWAPDPNAAPKRHRSTQEMLEELVERVRSIDTAQARTFNQSRVEQHLRDDDPAAVSAAVAVASKGTVRVDQVVHMLSGDLYVFVSEDKKVTRELEDAGFAEIYRRLGKDVKVTVTSLQSAATRTMAEGRRLAWSPAVAEQPPA